MGLFKKFSSFTFFMLSLYTFHVLGAEPSYLGISTYVTQVPTSGKGSPIKFEEVSLVKNVLVSDDKTGFVVQDAGVYQIVLVANAGATISGATGYVDCWFQKNGKWIPGTNTRITVDSPTSISIITVNFMEKLEKNDSVSIIFSASGPGLGLIAVKPIAEPYISAAALSIIRID